LFLEARKHFNGSQYTEALSDCITSLFYWENYRPSLDLMKLCYEKTGRQKEALQIQTRTEPWMHPPVFTNICFENGLCLRGLKLTKNSFKSGDAIEITYYFEAASDHDLDFFLFVHFKNCDGATLFQNDHRISGDTALIKGELIQDHQTIHIPETEKYSGPVDLCLGLWQPEKNKRLKMKTALPHKNKEAVLEKILIINE
ncbi:MAG: hypothetical protein JW774_12235, partial [Candidatus Aureabacteria bacterium]|nr:hypothetical protein [Candidatus Auribacterota bacterium]